MSATKDQLASIWSATYSIIREHGLLPEIRDTNTVAWPMSENMSDRCENDVGSTLNATTCPTVESNDGRVMAQVFQWYTIITVATGLLVNIHFGIYLIKKRKLSLFVPYLSGIIISNLIFLCFLAVNIVQVLSGIGTSITFCSFALFIMAITRNLPTLCLATIATERWYKLVCLNFTMEKTPYCSSRQVITTVLLVIFCTTVNTWVIPSAQLYDGGCVVFSVQGLESVASGLMLLNLILQYFVPFSLALLFNLAILVVLFKNTPGHHVKTTSIYSRLSGQSEKSMMESITSFTRRNRSRFPKFGLKFSDSRNSRILEKSSNGFSTVSGDTEPDKFSTADSMYKNVSVELSRKTSRSRKRTLIIFTTLTTLDMLFNFPNHFINIVQWFQPSLLGADITAAAQVIGFILWHLQFIVSGACVKLPLFRRRERTHVISTGLLGAGIVVAHVAADHYKDDEVHDLADVPLQCIKCDI